MTRVVFLDAAEEEMLEAAKFYEQQGMNALRKVALFIW